LQPACNPGEEVKEGGTGLVTGGELAGREAPRGLQHSPGRRRTTFKRGNGLRGQPRELEKRFTKAPVVWKGRFDADLHKGKDWRGGLLGMGRKAELEKGAHRETVHRRTGTLKTVSFTTSKVSREEGSPTWVRRKGG